ncbi:Aste57867_8087 [Aphanomyces stellatus]|uniref:Cilia- and flagella-associated protein 300 n=1 Tax=Aphanomyces stellatus TaxID=120398 RepID=A0A485KJB2_9STRA|nr:hypothetical protein As57867_008057 [Aphanomyces stellatus]VFT84976.1 Aste57867_8087 [Aphanomyces stellatus]
MSSDNNEAAADSVCYGFECIENNLSQWNASDVKLKLMQWNLDQHGGVKRFRVQGRFDPADDAAFLRAFFESKAVRAALPFPATMPGSLDTLPFSRLKTSVVNMSFFDKLEQCGDIVSKGGYLRKCLDDVYDDCTVNDCLRDMLVNPDSDHADLFSPHEQNEGIFQIFKRLVIGGAMCQPDDMLSEYLAMTKRIYKGLVSVRKAHETHDVKVYSPLYLVHDDDDCMSNQSEREGGAVPLFRKRSRFNACFVAVDPKKHAVICWYAPFVPFW